MIMRTDINKFPVNPVRFSADGSGQLPRRILRCFFRLCVNQICHRFRRSKFHSSVQKRTSGKFSRFCLSESEPEQAVQHGPQHNRRTVALKFHSVLSCIGMRCTAYSAQAQIQQFAGIGAEFSVNKFSVFRPADRFPPEGAEKFFRCGNGLLSRNTYDAYCGD